VRQLPGATSSPEFHRGARSTTLQDKLTSLLSSAGSGIAGGLLSAGIAVFSAVADSLIVLVLAVYFLVDMPRIRALLYRLFPHSRRARAILIGDDILAKVGGYVLGNLLVSLVAGGLTFGWLLIFGVPYALLLAIMVALLDLVPVVGSTIAGIIVALVTLLTVSLPLCLATIGFFILYRFGEDYFLVPRIIGRAGTGTGDCRSGPHRRRATGRRRCPGGHTGNSGDAAARPRGALPATRSVLITGRRFPEPAPACTRRSVRRRVNGFDRIGSD